jgi:hypothetical protein
MGRQSVFNRAAVLVLGILLMASSASVSVSAPVFDGDLCWTLKVNETEHGPEINPGMMTKFHIVSLDPTTFVMTGTVAVPGENPFIMTGTATKRGEYIVANLIGTQDHKLNENGNLWRDASTLRITFNNTTLKGLFFSIGQSFNRTTHTFDNEDYASGTLSNRACPQ